MKRLIYSTLILMALLVMTACGQKTPPASTTGPNVSTPTLPPTNTPAAVFSSDRLGLCFSYPEGYTPLPESDTVEIVAPALPDTDSRGLFWLEISDAYDRTAEVIADQDVALAGNVDVKRSTLTVGGEQAVVLDGMPGQDPQRRVYVVHQQKLYVLAFMPTLSANKALNDQIEALFSSVTTSWAWAPCSTGE